MLSRLMIWAVDLDDGTYIDSLGKGFTRPKQKIYPDAGYGGSDLGSGGLNASVPLL